MYEGAMEREGNPSVTLLLWVVCLCNLCLV